MASPFLWSPNVMLHEKDRSPNEKLRSICTFVHRNKGPVPLHKGPGPVGTRCGADTCTLALSLLPDRGCMELNSRKLFLDALNLNLKGHDNLSCDSVPY